LALEKIEYKVEIKVEISERDKKYIDYLFEKSEGDAYAVAERIALISQRTGQLIEDAETYQQGIKDIFSNHDKDEEFIAKWLSGEIKPEDLAKLGFTE
jgi:hypothetical protein